MDHGIVSILNACSIHLQRITITTLCSSFFLSERKNYRLRLFEDLTPNPMNLLEHEESLEYLPELSRSMKVRESEARNSNPASWTQWERFEGTVTQG